MSSSQSLPPVTRWLAARASAAGLGDLSATATTIARQCILDWYAVTIAGASEPAVQILAGELLAEGSTPAASLVGLSSRTSASNAALINGTASHALDFDDVNMAIVGHPSVAILPPILALAEQLGASQDDVLVAFVVGYDVACRTGLLVGPGHYDRGFHCTSTVGSIGAAAACSRLLGLDAETTATALGIAATRASGLKSMFGTMCKPLHAGMAAQNGLLAARLAAKGFSSRNDALECRQGFAATQSPDFNPEAAMQEGPLDLNIANNLFKFHAACYLTHGAIEAAREIRENYVADSDRIESISMRVPPIADKVCNLPTPATGLEAKFSLRLTVAMALDGRDTSAISTYDDDMPHDPKLVRLRDLATIDFDDDFAEAQSEIAITFANGDRHVASYDAGVPDSDLLRQGRKLERKFEALVKPVNVIDSDGLLAALTSFGGQEPVAEIAQLASRGG